MDKSVIILSILIICLNLFSNTTKIALIDYTKNKEYALKYDSESKKEHYSNTTLKKETISLIINEIKNNLIKEDLNIIDYSELNDIFNTIKKNTKECKDMICINNIFNENKNIIIVNIIPKFDNFENKNVVIIEKTVPYYSSMDIPVNDDNINSESLNNAQNIIILGENYSNKPQWTNTKEGIYLINGKKIFRTVGYSKDLNNKNETMRSAGDNAFSNLSGFINSIRTDNSKSVRINFSPEQKVKTWVSINGEVYILFEEFIDNIKKSNPDIPASVFDNLKVIETIE